MPSLRVQRASDEFARDPIRITRFQREAEALASLTHSNIGAIHDLQEVDDTTFLVLDIANCRTSDRSTVLKPGPS